MSEHDIIARDALYGSIEGSEIIQLLVALPAIQRLRHVRLSNIDSVDLPGIANLSRYEHVLGVYHLASNVGFLKNLPTGDRTALKGAALLHDVAITAFGHLIEEAFQYSGFSFDHEARMRLLLTGEASDEVGGIERQILLGRETGLHRWALAAVEGDQTRARDLMFTVAEHVLGRGMMGRVVAGDIDLDNIDNVFRVAYHMGLQVERELPVRLARAMVGLTGEDGNPLFRSAALGDIKNWLAVRREVYNNLMLARKDFTGKLMMLYAATMAISAKDLSEIDWALTDSQLIQRLLSSCEEARAATTEWIAGELWPVSPLLWLDGQRPDYANLLAFSKELSTELNRTCFAYGIKDKRDRKLTAFLDDGRTYQCGSAPRQWLFGVGSPLRRAFNSRENKIIIGAVSSFFKTKVLGPAADPSATPHEAQSCLF